MSEKEFRKEVVLEGTAHMLRLAKSAKPFLVPSDA